MTIYSETKRNNLHFYDNVTRASGPAMTWSMHAVGFLDLKEEEEAAKVFERSYAVYTHEPFKTWSENQPGDPGVGNFITGAGGFLQSLINGYAGIRLHFDHLSITNFFVPPSSSALELKGITYLNNRFNLEIVGNTTTLKFIEVSDTQTIKVYVKPSNTQYGTSINVPIVFRNDEELIIEPMAESFGNCEMKKTELGQVAGVGMIKIELLLIAALAMIKFIF